MDPKIVLSIYQESAAILLASEAIRTHRLVRFRGLSASSGALVGSSITSLLQGLHIFILDDRESAAYFVNDLQNFIGREQILFFPSSYRKPYQFEEIENANVLQRAEVLSEINGLGKGERLIVVTYPDALYEKVINKRSLVDNTFSVKTGDKLDTQFLTDLLINYDFEISDFVFEPGQFSVRGGILDIFSFSHEYPYRLELSGDELESIREFDPETQLSVKSLDRMNLVPNVQTNLIKEEHQSFLRFVGKDAILWLKDYQATLDLIDKGFNKATESFRAILEASGNTQVVLSPADLFVSEADFEKELLEFKLIEFGTRFHLEPDTIHDFGIKPQPSFHKNFNLLAEDLYQFQSKGFKLFICAESHNQLDRLQTIFEEINPEINFNGISGSLKEGFIDEHHELLCYTDHQIFDRHHRYQSREKFSKSKSLTLRELKALNPGDYVVHIDYGVGRFAGLDTVDVSGNKQEALRIVYRDDDLLYVSIHSLHKISKYSGKEGLPPAMSKLGSQDWENKKKKVKNKVKDIAKDLILLYAKRKAAPGFAYEKDNYLQAELESSFLYQDTPDQAMATADVKKDMEQAHPMDRLVCGDVGFGKTEVAIRAAFKAVLNGRQVAVLVPTTILAMQHYHTFSERLADFPVKVEYINRFKSSAEIARIKKELKEGKIDVLIGTHRIVNKDIDFKQLGLMVIDEEQKFGVKVKERLKEMRVNVDALTLTATPIPRTLHFSLMGARDLSIISTPPPNRRPVTTESQEYNEEIIRDAISRELRRGGQVFFVHNRISDIEKHANVVLKMVPEARIGIAHGQMEGKQLEKIMLKFIEGEYDVLVSTNIIESGLDIPNANTIIINRAHMFGLSDLHQMRGRVGRSNTQAYCYLLTPPAATLSSDSRKRLTTLEEFSDLGDGFKVAMRDLDIRGAGNLLGSEQSGFISDMGFEMYHKILDEAVGELKENEFRSLFENDESNRFEGMADDCLIETDLEILIPENYVSNISERLALYSKIDGLATEDELKLFEDSLRDRFGPIPENVRNLMASVRMRWKAINIGFEKLTLKSRLMKCYISEKKDEGYFQSDTFGQVLQFVKAHPHQCKMKDLKNKLILQVTDVESIRDAIQILSLMEFSNTVV